MNEHMQRAAFVLPGDIYRKVAQNAGNVEGFCWKCGATKQYTPEQLEQIMRNWPTCKKCKERIHVRVKK